MLPRSACPQCGHQIHGAGEYPVLSYLFLRGCSVQGAHLGALSAVELLTGLLSAGVIWRFGSGWMGLSCLVFLYA
jgi:leader peptidase (prepilin peptidase)/N-methyltransferase